MLTQIITIISLLVFVVLLVSGSTVEPALIKTGAVFLALSFGYMVCRFLVSVIKKTSAEEKSSSSKSAG